MAAGAGVRGEGRTVMASQAQACSKRPAGPPVGENACKFKISVAKKEKPAARVPKAGELGGAAIRVPPPNAVLQKLGGAKIVVGLDIETADWVGRMNNTGRGQFGFYHFCHPDDYLQKIVQIGRAIAEVRVGAPLLDDQEHWVQPEGFAISEKATKKHGITNEAARD